MSSMEPSSCLVKRRSMRELSSAALYLSQLGDALVSMSKMAVMPPMGYYH